MLDKGNSHKLKNLVTVDIDTWLSNPSDINNVLFFKNHPKTKHSHSLTNNVDQLTSYFKKSILLYPSKNTYLLHSNNLLPNRLLQWLLLPSLYP